MPEQSRYPLTWGLILLSLAGYIVEALCGGGWSDLSTRTLVECGGVYGPAIFAAGEWWRLITGLFLHGGPEHLALNMISLYIVGRIIERYFRPFDYLILYFFSGVGGFLVSLAWHPETVIIGASGAIFGLFGALGGFLYFHRESLGERYRIFMREFGAILAINLVFDLVVPGIDLSAHVAGLVLGLLGGYLTGSRRPLFLLFVIGTGIVMLGWGYWLAQEYSVNGMPLFLF
jgi:rhomboid protease GluP